MTTSEADPEDDLLILAPAGRDAEVLGQMLASAGLFGRALAADGPLLEAIRSGEAAGAILTEEGLARLPPGELAEALAAQPPWSDFPFVLLGRRGRSLAGGSQALEELGAVTLLERPLHPSTLISAARAVCRARRRQREAQAYLAEREAAEAALRELAATLEARVAERTRDLAAANDRLTAEIAERRRAEERLVQAQKMEAIGQLTGGIAHDFNNSLAAVIGSLDMLIGRTDDARLRRLAENALAGAERGARLTGQLLAFSRRQRLEPSALKPNEVVAELGDLLARTLGAGVRVETELTDQAWTALVDPTQFEVMLINLAINARDAMPEGGVLAISTENLREPPVGAHDLPAGDYVAVTVRDTGVGMPPRVLARAFEPFFTTKAQGAGTGLGLSQVYGFARQSGGAAVIASREGEGTAVTVVLPRCTEVQAAEAARAEGDGRPGADGRGRAGGSATGARTVLVVDDDAGVREVAASMLEELGFEVVAVDSGAEALVLLRHRAFDLLVTDVAMPGMTGVELAEAARDMDPELPILFASGYADLDAFGDRLADADLVKKPFRLADLARLTRAALDAAPPAAQPGSASLRP